ncbi:alpha/beta fold hydrolase [Streptomyces sp. NPDC058622]|uniref:alpha/beta fold hydrolase n=1 Tax=Streptomyces sp. NPDC058622 TaxID=3346562 RepID=UPI003655BDF1
MSAPLLNSFTAEQVRAAAEQTASALPPGTGAQVDLVRRTDVRADLALITAPTLVVVTTADNLIPAALQYQLSEAIPGARTAELATGQLPFLEQPKEWLEIITGFLGRQQDRG